MSTEAELIKPGENYQIWKTGRLTPNHFSELTCEEQLKYIITCGQMAASSHNTQPWGVKIDSSSKSFSIFLDKGRVLAASDINGRQACISTGCFITNIGITSRYFGLTPQIEFAKIDPKTVKPTQPTGRFIPTARILLSNETLPNPVNRELFEAIFTRRMNRGQYDKHYVITETLIDELSQICTTNQTSLHTFSRNSMFGGARIRAIAELQAQADNYVANKQDFSDELGQWFLPNDTTSALGMPGDTFGLQDEDALHFAQGFRNEIELTANEKAGFAGVSKAGIESASTVGGITVPKDQPLYWIKAGMALQEIALHLEKNGLAMAVHAGLAEVVWTSRLLNPMFRAKDRLVTLFRAGLPQEVRPHSPRLAVEEILL